MSREPGEAGSMEKARLMPGWTRLAYASLWDARLMPSRKMPGFCRVGVVCPAGVDYVTEPAFWFRNVRMIMMMTMMTIMSMGVPGLPLMVYTNHSIGCLGNAREPFQPEVPADKLEMTINETGRSTPGGTLGLFAEQLDKV